MAVIPVPLVEQLEFCETHWPVWLLNAAPLSVPVAQINAFKAKTVLARQKYDAARAARQAAQAATTAQNAAIADALRDAADLIRVIKGTAEFTDDPDALYALAQIPAPAPPSPLPVPGKPTDINITLLPGGAVALSWKCINASAGSGVFFTVRRRLPHPPHPHPHPPHPHHPHHPGDDGYTLVGSVPGTTRRSHRVTFTDETLPHAAAAEGARYIIQGRRGATFGEASDAVIVQFGVGGAGGGGGLGGG